MIEIKNLNKSFDDHQVLKDINLKINDGDIYGILGFSGAGKSTLVRCLNGLESPDSGEIIFNNHLLCNKDTKVSKSDLKDISMIFQSFNLLNQKNVISNIELAFKLQNIKIKYDKKEYKKKKKEYDVSVICFGLKTNFKSEFFEGSKRLFELCDKFKELETICSCGTKARFNARMVNNKFIKEGEEFVIDGENKEVKYVPLCSKCYLEKVFKSNL